MAMDPLYTDALKELEEVKAQRDEYRNHLAVIAEMTGNKGDIGAAHEGVNAVIEELAARLKRIEFLNQQNTILQEQCDALALRNTGLIQQCSAAEQQRDTHLNKLRTLNHGDASEAWHWMNDGNDQLESLTCPILISAEDLKGIFEERDALAAHVCQLTSIAEKVCTISPEYLDHLASDAAFVLKTTPTTSLARCDALKQAEAMRHVAKWLSGEIEEGCIGLDLGGEISGPTGCSDADKCRVAGERIFREAARIWECRFVLEDQQ